MLKKVGMEVLGSWMDKAKASKTKLILLLMFSLILIAIISVTSSSNFYKYVPERQWPTAVCPYRVSQQTITPINNTKHFMISGFMDQRAKGLDVRIIGMFKKNSIQPLYCLFCCAGSLSTTTPASVVPHQEHFGFAYVTTAVMCQIPHDCNATHLTLLTEPHKQDDPQHKQNKPQKQGPSKPFNCTWLPLRNRNNRLPDKEKLKFNFTVCISSLFGEYENVLQFAQTLEMYRLLGVDRVVIYNTSCGKNFGRLLQIYSQEGFLEVVPWPIDKYLNPSHGWLFSSSGGDVHYYGQMTTLNECIYRNMERSRYVLLNDMDEIVMPYQHKNLMSLMNALQKDYPNTGVYRIENHVFPKTKFDPNGTFHLPRWNGVPGINILEHIYKEEPDRKLYHPHKMIIQPRMVEQTSVHEVLKTSGKQVKVPPNICRIIHVRSSIREPTYKDFQVDKRLWDFQEQLVPKVDAVLKKLGLLNQTDRAD